MSALVERLSSWRGPEWFGNQLFAQGLHISRHYTDTVAAYCDGREKLERYWHEMAKEYVSSAGRAKSSTRNFPSSGMYRSAYLDELAVQCPRSPNSELYFLHPGVEEFERRGMRNPGFRMGVTTALEAKKQSEIAQREIDGILWDGSKKGAREVLRGLLLARGFSPFKRDFVKQTCGLMLIVHFDTGGRKDCMSVSPTLILATDLELTEFFPFAFSGIAPGFDYYKIFFSAPSAMLGLQAYADASDILLDSFND